MTSPRSCRTNRDGFTTLAAPLFFLGTFGLAYVGGLAFALLASPATLVVAVWLIPPDPYYLPSRTPLLAFGAARRRRAREGRAPVELRFAAVQ